MTTTVVSKKTGMTVQFIRTGGLTESGSEETHDCDRAGVDEFGMAVVGSESKGVYLAKDVTRTG